MYNDNQRQIIVEALKQTELQLEDMQAIAAATEARSFQFAGSCVLIATLGVAFANQVPNAFTMYLASVGLVLAAVWAIYSVLPRRYHIRGHRWEDWEGHVKDDDDFYAVLISQAKENDERIKFNYSVLEASASHFNVSYLLAMFSISIFALGQYISV